MWVKFKIWWQDGLYKYQPGMVVLLPSDLARRYCYSGKAEPCQPPKEFMQEQKTKKKSVPSARARIKRMSSTPKHEMNLADYASEISTDED